MFASGDKRLITMRYEDYFLLWKQPLINANLRKAAEIRRKKEFRRFIKKFENEEVLWDIRQVSDKENGYVMLYGKPNTNLGDHKKIQEDINKNHINPKYL